ncbi:hypothetical protein LMH73_020310 [Vibrio splendidus]|nr:hypothetical protein [Vibrio splendidus]MCC4880557.1 hypothetical protein [Vibrio splendidus]
MTSNAQAVAVQVYTKGSKRNVLSLVRANSTKKDLVEKKQEVKLSVSHSNISDDEAFRRANMLTPENQNIQFKHRSKLSIANRSADQSLGNNVISDDEAFQRANMLTPESQNHHTQGNAQAVNRTPSSGKQGASTAGTNTQQRSDRNIAPRHAQKEINRIPGLYGCNRWKSAKESQNNCVEFSVF